MLATPTKLSLNFNKSNYNVFGIRAKDRNLELQKEQKTELLEGNKGNGPLILKNGVDYVNPGEEDQMEIYGYKRNKTNTAITWFFIVITCGGLRLLFHWCARYMLYTTHSKCKLEEAEKVLLLDSYKGKTGRYFVKKVKTISAQDIWNKFRDDNEKTTILTKEKKKNGCTENSIITIDSTQQDLDQEKIPTSMSFYSFNGHLKESQFIITFSCKKLNYIWDAERREFLKLSGLDNGVLSSILHQTPGLSTAHQIMRRGIYGNNEIIVPLSGFFILLALEILNPFYVFQLLSFALWMYDDYFYYAIVILTMTSVSVVLAVRQTQKNQRNLHSSVTSSEVVNVLRDRTNGTTAMIPAQNLVPGDVLVIPSHGCMMPCDAVLLTGNCIINESMLTGESVPVTKTPIPACNEVVYDEKEHARHTLYSGTKILQTRYFGSEKVLAVVVRTGFNTSKGGLVRSIMYPPPVDFKFEQDSYLFITGLFCIATVGVFITVFKEIARQTEALKIMIMSLDLYTIVVPPALPAAMTIGRMMAQKRLETKKIYCTSPRAINISGSIDCVCFDKTGTLTEDGLDMWGVVTVSDKKFQLPNKNVASLSLDQVLIGMVSCHSITIIDGQLIGDPLDLKMFESTGWILEEPNVSDTSKFSMLFPTIVRPPNSKAYQPTNDENNFKNENVELTDDGVVVGIVRQFPFTSSLQRMSVITRRLGDDHYELFCKGSPEMIHSLSNPDSIPDDFNNILTYYTSEGYRVIALAYKSLKKLSYAKVQRITREIAESELNFLGFVILENRLKPETMPVIAELNEAAIKVVMVTGDNILTALSVARDCDIIKPGVPVIAVTAIQSVNQNKPKIYYTKSESQTNGNTNDNHHQGNNNNNSSSPIVPEIGDYSEITDINSVVSLETIESGLGTRGDSVINGPSENYVERNNKTIDGGNNKFMAKKNDYVFALTGKTWALLKQHYPELIPKICTRGAIFARMSPDQKQQLIQELQALKYYVAMVGDGANDCGALKAAHTGISLSDTESSVASPFTSRETNISCILTLIREGRAALVTSFGIFKFMAAYSLTQYISVLLLYDIMVNLSDMEFLYIDLFIISAFAYTFSNSKANDDPLHKIPPENSLVSLTSFISLFAQIALVFIFQMTSYKDLCSKDWYVPLNITSEDEQNSSHENYAIFIISSFQYIILAIVFSKGRPYRSPILKNRSLLGCFVGLTLISIYMTLGMYEPLRDIFELLTPEDLSYKLELLIMALTNFILAMIIEYLLVEYLLYEKLGIRWLLIGNSSKFYQQHEKEMSISKSWPPLSQEPLPEVTNGTAAPDLLSRRNQIAEIKIEKSVTTKSLPTEMDDVGGSSQRGDVKNDWSTTRPDCLPPFDRNDRFGGSQREVPLDPRSLCDDKRNTVSMQTVLLNHCDDDKTERSKSLSNGNAKSRLNSESAREIYRDIDDKPKKTREMLNSIATLPRHSVTVINSIGNEEKYKQIAVQNVLELDVMPS